MRLACVGDCGVDHYEPSGERLIGGITANFAHHARRTFGENDEVAVVSCVGDDAAGSTVMASLADSGIKCHLTVAPGSTPVQRIGIASDGEKRFLHYDEGVLQHFSFSKAQERIIAEADGVVAPVFLQINALYEALMAIPICGRVAIDFADFREHPDFGLLDRYSDRIDVGFFGLSLADEPLIDDIARRAREHGKLLVVTLGPDGSIVFQRGARFECPATPVRHVVDTTGAGDAYAAGFLSRWWRGAGIQESMAHGAALAARVVSRLGSQVG
jgi:sugar/nucleoside kinase (ribokinase family)